MVEVALRFLRPNNFFTLITVPISRGHCFLENAGLMRISGQLGEKRLLIEGG